MADLGTSRGFIRPILNSLIDSLVKGYEEVASKALAANQVEIAQQAVSLGKALAALKSEYGTSGRPLESKGDRALSARQPARDASCSKPTGSVPQHRWSQQAAARE